MAIIETASIKREEQSRAEKNEEKDEKLKEKVKEFFAHALSLVVNY